MTENKKKATKKEVVEKIEAPVKQVKKAKAKECQNLFISSNLVKIYLLLCRFCKRSSEALKK